MAASTPRRLTTWKDIGAYIGRDARTAKRYEAERRLPVHRLPGETRSVVFAFSEELDAWLRRQPIGAGLAGEDGVSPPDDAQRASPSADTEPTVDARPATATGAARLAWGFAAIVACLCVGLLVLEVRMKSSAAGRKADPIAAAAFKDGEFAWRQRTPASLDRAVDDFTQAIVRDPDYAEAYVGLANAYDLMPEFGDMSPADAYTRAEAAAKRALALEPRSAAAHRTYGFILFWWEHNVPRAWSEFATALRLDPASSEAHHWYANTLAEMGDPRALKEIDAARSLDPASTSIMIDAAAVRMGMGRLSEARQLLQAVAAAAPDAPNLHRSLATLHRVEGDYPGMLAERARWGQLRHDPDITAEAAAGQRGLASGGPTAMWAAMLPLEEVANREGRLQSSMLAADELRLGRRAEAMRLLEDASAKHEPNVPGLAGDADFAALRDEPAFKRLVARIGAPD